MDSCCDSCKDRDTCKIWNLGLEWGCVKHELIKKKMSFECQLERLYNDQKALDERDLKGLAEDGIAIMDALEKGWL